MLPATARKDKLPAPVREEAPAKIGFAIRDSDPLRYSVAVDEKSGEALVFGSETDLRVKGAGILPAHFVVLPFRGRLLAASANAQAPAMLNGQPLPTTWTELAVPSRIRLGTAAVDFFLVRDGETLSHDLDVVPTVATVEGKPVAPAPRRNDEITREAVIALRRPYLAAATSTGKLPPVVVPPMRPVSASAATIAAPEGHESNTAATVKIESSSQDLPDTIAAPVTARVPAPVAIPGAPVSSVRPVAPAAPVSSPSVASALPAASALSSGVVPVVRLPEPPTAPTAPTEPISRLKAAWRSTPRTTFILVGVVALLGIVALAQPPRDADSHGAQGTTASE